jgi:hypothetical protein
MRIRRIITLTALTGSLLSGGTVLGANMASASNTQLPNGTFESVVNQGTAIYGTCANTVRTTTTYFHWSKTLGWVAYPRPKVTSTSSWVCH